MIAMSDRIRQLEAENAALWRVASSVRKHKVIEAKLLKRFGVQLVVDMGRREFKRQRPLFEQMCDQTDAAERDVDDALDALAAFERGDVA